MVNLKSKLRRKSLQIKSKLQESENATAVHGAVGEGQVQKTSASSTQKQTVTIGEVKLSVDGP